MENYFQIIFTESKILKINFNFYFHKQQKNIFNKINQYLFIKGQLKKNKNGNLQYHYLLKYTRVEERSRKIRNFYLYQENIKYSCN